MYRFCFKHIEQLTSIDLQKGQFLWVWHANKIPPHIGVSLDGAYYSLKVSGKDIGLPANRVLPVIYEKNIPFVAIELTTISKNIEEVFSKYTCARAGEISCLEPIKELLNVASTCSKLEELLLELQLQHKIGRIIGINLPKDFIYLPEYTKAEINNRLAKLEDAQRREYIS